MLNHPHVIQMKDVFVAGGYINIVLELADDGMLFGFVNESLRANGGVMQEEDARWGWWLPGLVHWCWLGVGCWHSAV